MKFQLTYSSQGLRAEKGWYTAPTSFLNKMLNNYIDAGFKESVYTDLEGKGLWVLSHPVEGIRVISLAK